jgi:hypothetical protein
MPTQKSKAAKQMEFVELRALNRKKEFSILISLVSFLVPVAFTFAYDFDFPWNVKLNHKAHVSETAASATTALEPTDQFREFLLEQSWNDPQKRVKLVE